MHIDISPPPQWPALARRTAEIGFDMPSEPAGGAFLRMLAASKPGGRLLELGTGTGLATAWLLDGMDAAARLVSIDNDDGVQAPARDLLGEDARVRFVTGDGLAYIRAQPAASFDLIFADAWPGKYEGLEDALALLAPGGLYIGDDMLPQPNWQEGHQARLGFGVRDRRATRRLMLWIPVTIAAAAFQVARNAAQRSLMTGAGPWGATLVRFLFGLPFACAFASVALAVAPHALSFTPAFFGWATLGAFAQIGATAALLVAMHRSSFALGTAFQQSGLPFAALIGFFAFGDHLSLAAWGGILL
eukprot:gene15187-14984_t